jgi:hypothetical protein
MGDSPARGCRLPEDQNAGALNDTVVPPFLHASSGRVERSTHPFYVEPGARDADLARGQYGWRKMDPSLHYVRRARGDESRYLKRLLFANFSREAVQPVVAPTPGTMVGTPPGSILPAGKGWVC